MKHLSDSLETFLKFPGPDSSQEVSFSPVRAIFFFFFPILALVSTVCRHHIDQANLFFLLY